MSELDSEDEGRIGVSGELADIIREGWYTADCGSLLLVRIGEHARSWPCAAEAIAQREYEINDVRISDLDLVEERERFLRAVTRRAYGFAKGALASAAGIDGSADLVAVVSVGVDEDYLSHGATVKFFTKRGDYPDWFDELDRFESEAVMIMQMGDIEGYSAD